MMTMGTWGEVVVFPCDLYTFPLYLSYLNLQLQNKSLRVATLDSKEESCTLVITLWVGIWLFWVLWTAQKNCMALCKLLNHFDLQFLSLHKGQINNLLELMRMSWHVFLA